MGRRKGAPITGTSSPSATTRCFCSLSTGTALPPRCGPAMCIAPRTGTICSCRKLTGSGLRASVWRSALTPRSRSREIYDALEKRDVDYGIRIPANRSLELEIEDILFRPPGRPSCKPLVRYKSVRYQAKSWTTPRRIVAKVEHHRGELFPRVGFIVTNMVLPSRSVVRFYNKRGTAEQWIKEGKQATHWTRLSCHRFRANEVRLQLSVLAYNLGNLWRRLVLPPRIKRWSLTSLQHRLVKTGGRLVKHAAVLLAPAGGRSSDPAAVRRHAAEDLGTAGARRLTRGLSATKRRRQGTRVERCLRNTLEAGAPVGFPSSAAPADGSWERNNVR